MSILRGPSTSVNLAKIQKLFEAVALAKPKDTAIIYEDHSGKRIHTYEELNNLSDKLAEIIKEIVVKNGLYNPKEKKHFIVGVYMNASDFLIITLMAIWKIGGSYLPLDPTYPDERIEYIVNDTKPALIIYNRDEVHFYNTYKMCISDFVSSYRNFTGKRDKKEDYVIAPESNPATVLYTSGSTGNPKGVTISHETILNRLEWQLKKFPFGPNEKIGVFTTVLTFVDSIFEIWGPLVKGLTVLVLPRSTIKNPEKLCEALDKYEIQRLVLVPSLLQSILMYIEISNKKNLLSNLNLCISSGEVLKKDLVNKFYNNFEVGKTTLCNCYGSTEVTDITYYTITNPNELYKYQGFPLGTPINNTEIYILDANLSLLPKGQTGEIYASGLNLPLQFISQHHQDSIIDNPFNSEPTYSKLFKTGDLGRILDDLLFFYGRSDNVVKIRGFRVDLTEIENRIHTMPGVKHVTVLCYKPGTIYQTILVFVDCVDKNGGKEIEYELKKSFQDYMVPVVVQVEKFPLLEHGKTDREALLKTYNEDRLKKGIDFTGVPAEKLPAAKVLLETVASVATSQLQVKISLQSNFFQVGGNSLNAVYVINVLKNNGFVISIYDFVKAANFKEMLDKIVKSSGKVPTNITENVDYVMEILQEKHKKEALDIIVASFLKKSALEILVGEITQKQYYDYLEQRVWPEALSSGLSFVVKTKGGSIIAASLNGNGDTDLKINLSNPRLATLDKFYTFLETSFKHNLLKGYSKVFWVLKLGTNQSITTQENILVVHFIEDHIISLAKAKKYECIFRFNQSPLTKDLGVLYGYESNSTYQVNQYIADDNTEPFEDALDSETIQVQFKKL